MEPYARAPAKAPATTSACYSANIFLISVYTARYSRAPRVYASDRARRELYRASTGVYRRRLRLNGGERKQRAPASRELIELILKDQRSWTGEEEGGLCVISHFLHDGVQRYFASILERKKKEGCNVNCVSAINPINFAKARTIEGGRSCSTTMIFMLHTAQIAHKRGVIQKLAAFSVQQKGSISVCR